MALLINHLISIIFLAPFLFTSYAHNPASSPGTDHGLVPAVPISLNKHFSSPPSGLNMMGVYSTNFNETPYCCPWAPKAFEISPPPTLGWGTVPTVCQVADAGQNGVFNDQGTVLLGQSWLMSNGSVAYYGQAGSRNGVYGFGFAMEKDFQTLNGFYMFQDESNSTMDGGVLTGPWIWTFVREPTMKECFFALRETRDTISKFEEMKNGEER